MSHLTQTGLLEFLHNRWILV